MKNKKLVNNFGERLSTLRKAKGLTQTELGQKVGVSKRMIAYYEGQTQRPPAHLLVPLAKTLKISVDELIGFKNVQLPDSTQAALWRKLKKAEHLSAKNIKVLFAFIDALLEKNKTKT